MNLEFLFPYYFGRINRLAFGPITKEELKKVLKRLKGSASPGPDGVGGWCYKHGGEYILDALYDCFNQSIENEYAST